jgi:hypothetical protein
MTDQTARNEAADPPVLAVGQFGLRHELRSDLYSDDGLVKRMENRKQETGNRKLVIGSRRHSRFEASSD